MKRALLIAMAGSIPSLVSSQTILIDQNFDSFTSGDLVAQTCGLPWSTWSVAPGGTEDTPISDEQASSGTLSAKVSGPAAGGPTDLILRLGNRTTGTYALGWNMYIPAGNGGYFNIQRNEVPGTGSFMLEVTFKADGTIEFLNNAVMGTPGSYTHDTWFNLTMAFDLSTMTAALAIDGTPQYTWQTNVPGPNQVGGIDFYSYAGGTDVPTYYIDDVLFLDLSSTNVPEVAPTGIAVYPNPTQDLVTIDLPNASTTAIA